MRGGYVHTDQLILPLETWLRLQGAGVHREYRIVMDGRVGWGDLLAIHGRLRLLVEAELTPDRVAGDLWKAEAVEATHLLIPVPNHSVELKVRRVLAGVNGDQSCQILCHTLPKAIQRLSELLSGRNVLMTSDKKGD